MLWDGRLVCGLCIYQKVEFSSMEVEAKCYFPVETEEHNIVMLFDLRGWLGSRSCKEICTERICSWLRKIVSASLLLGRKYKCFLGKHKAQPWAFSRWNLAPKSASPATPDCWCFLFPLLHNVCAFFWLSNTQFPVFTFWPTELFCT